MSLHGVRGRQGAHFGGSQEFLHMRHLEVAYSNAPEFTRINHQLVRYEDEVDAKVVLRISLIQNLLHLRPCRRDIRLRNTRMVDQVKVNVGEIQLYERATPVVISIRFEGGAVERSLT